MHPNDGRVVSNFIVQALSGEDITIYGSGEQSRSFCFVDDLIDGIVKFMELKDDFPGPMNLGNPVEFSILELAETVIRITNSKSKIVFGELPQDDPRQRKPDIGLAKEKIAWEPKVQLEEGLTKSVEYFSKLDPQAL
jgi:UDP-glucuronate decarboxylase